MYFACIVSVKETRKVLDFKQNVLKALPCLGVEPGSQVWQAGILTTILTRVLVSAAHFNNSIFGVSSKRLTLSPLGPFNDLTKRNIRHPQLWVYANFEFLSEKSSTVALWCFKAEIFLLDHFGPLCPVRSKNEHSKYYMPCYQIIPFKWDITHLTWGLLGELGWLSMVMVVVGVAICVIKGYINLRIQLFSSKRTSYFIMFNTLVEGRNKVC